MFWTSLPATLNRAGASLIDCPYNLDWISVAGHGERRSVRLLFPHQSMSVGVSQSSWRG